MRRCSGNASAVLSIGGNSSPKPAESAAGGHIDDTHGFETWTRRRLDAKKLRFLAALDTAPKFALGSNNQVLVERICFSAAASSENDQGSMNLASKTASLPSIRPSRVAAIHRSAG